MGAIAAVIVACGSSDDSKFKDAKVNPNFIPSSGIKTDSGENADPNGELFKNDPPPAYCGPEAGGVTQRPIGGTEACPDDKNKPGCGCTNVGEEANCWTGLRKHRGLGVCRDGRTKCIKRSENENVWGTCDGQVFPKENASGELACSCFSVGLWKIANTIPCVWNKGGDNGWYAYSTERKTFQKDGQTFSYSANCGEGTDPSRPAGTDNPMVPPIPQGSNSANVWSANTLKTDCAGSFTLVFRIRVGDIDNPKADDCILGESETFADYREANVEQALPDLPHWNNGSNPACVKKWEVDTPADVSPGYGEMIVKGGQTVACEKVADVNNNSEFVFNRVQFCPRICRDSVNKDHPACKECQERGQGSF